MSSAGVSAMQFACGDGTEPGRAVDGVGAFGDGAFGDGAPVGDGEGPVVAGGAGAAVVVDGAVVVDVDVARDPRAR